MKPIKQLEEQLAKAKNALSLAYDECGEAKAKVNKVKAKVRKALIKCRALDDALGNAKAKQQEQSDENN